MEYPLSIGQQALWFLAQRFPERGLYNVSAAWRLPNDISPGALHRATLRLSARHPVWRTSFSQRDGIPFQRVHAHLPPGFQERHVLETVGMGFGKVLDAEAARPLNLEDGPPVRWVLFSADGQRPVLLLVVHHTVVDGWSISTLLRDLGALYREESGGPPVNLPPPARRYSEFIQENTQWQSSPDGEREREFWDKTLPKTIPLLDLPTDYPRRSEPSFDSGCLLFPIPPALRKKMRQLAKDSGVRPLAIWLALWFVFLHRLSGHEELVTQIPIAGRGQDYDGLLGFFVNTLPLCVRCSGAEGFRAFLKRTAGILEDALSHRHWPFPLMVRSVDRNTLAALLQNTFSWQNYNHFGGRDAALVTAFRGAGDTWGDIWQVGDMAWELVRLPQQRDETDIQLQLINLPDNQYGALQYASDLFERSTIERWIGHFMCLLQGIAAEPDTPISRFSLLTEAERVCLLIGWNDTKTPYPANKCIHELFEQQAAKTPDAIAVIFEDEEVGYGELNARANRLARRLRKLGIGPEVLVGLFVERSVEMIVGLLAILKGGGAYVPLDPEYPAERLAFMMEDARLAVLLCHGATRERVPECTARILDMDADAVAISGEDPGNPARLAAPNNLAYVIYTSGSTGKPKGVMIEHRGLTNLAWAQTRAFRIVPTDRVLQFASLNFDASLEQIFSAFLGGAGLVLRGSEVWTVEECWHQVWRQRVTIAEFPPVYLHQFLAFLLKNSDVSVPILLKQLISGGETLSGAAAALCRKLGLPLFNTYGPTEAAITSTNFYLSPDQEIAGSTIPIGRPIANTRVYILDTHMTPVPIGIPGELYIGGAGVARGYLNRPELTAEKFIPDPFSDDPEARLYRTGDRCRWLPGGNIAKGNIAKGNIEFLGRIDTQVKIRGFRIECGEIESALLSASGVREAIVDVLGEGEDKRLVAWIVPKDSYLALQPGLRAYLRARLRESLPAWMVPSVFMLVETLPLTPNGKIDRRALPNPDADQSDTQTQLATHHVGPRDSIEDTLCRVFSQVLGIRRAGIHDDFFDLGGHSLLATRVISLIREQLGLEMPLRAVFDHPTPAALATAVRDRAQWRPTILFPLNIGAEDTKAPLFCIHPVGGGAFCYRELADCLGKDQPVYGIQAVGFEGDATPLADVEAMAARYVAEITALWPNGPCRLYGWSFGGVVAFEMARLLRAAGREIDLLVLADTAHPSRFDGMKELAEQEITAHLLAEAGDPVSAPAMTTDNNLERFRFIRIHRANSRALQAYRPSPWKGPILFLSAETPMTADGKSFHLAWRDLAKQLIHRVTPGDHFTMHRQPNVRAIAEILGEMANG
ncbi:MAG: amino acid adenylation domain-containing protein [Gammaproteobacteria bacterium]|nr:amino acid adenylation domain-containing protein [Gammaproteobacteria bacterium]